MNKEVPKVSKDPKGRRSSRLDSTPKSSVQTSKSISKSKRSSSSSTPKKPSGGITRFTTYFRDKQRKEDEKKKEDLRVAAEKLRQVLTPVKFSHEEELRLAELKQYKRWKRQIEMEEQEKQQKIREKTLPSIPEPRVAPPTPLGDSGLRMRSLGSPGRSSAAGNVRNRSAASNGTTAAVSPAEKGTLQDRLEVLHHHTWEQRVSIVASLILLLFISLHADAFGKRILPELLFQDSKVVPWYIMVVKDWGRFCHMSACSLIHFALCDISLIYAFESMELGAKTGPKVKRFYREKVHLAMAAFSGGIVALSICKALFMAWFRILRDLVVIVKDILVYICSYPMSGFYVLKAVFLYFKFIAVLILSVPAAIFSFIYKGLILLSCARVTLQSAASPSKLISSFFASVTRILTGICIWILALLMPFNTKDRSLTVEHVPLAKINDHNNLPDLELTESSTLDHVQSGNDTTHVTGAALKETMNSTLSYAAAHIHRMANFSASNETSLNETEFDTVEVNDFDSAELTPKEVIYWRNDAFETCRFLLLYSAFFLVALLISFNVLAKSYRHADPPADNCKDGDVSIAHSSLQTTPSMANDEIRRRNNSARVSVARTGSNETTSTPQRPTSITVTISSSYSS